MPVCCVALSIRLCGVRKVRLIPHDVLQAGVWTARALHPDIFEQPAQNDFFNNLLIVAARIRFLDLPRVSWYKQVQVETY